MLHTNKNKTDHLRSSVQSVHALSSSSSPGSNTSARAVTFDLHTTPQSSLADNSDVQIHGADTVISNNISQDELHRTDTKSGIGLAPNRPVIGAELSVKQSELLCKTLGDLSALRRSISAENNNIHNINYKILGQIVEDISAALSMSLKIQSHLEHCQSKFNFHNTNGSNGTMSRIQKSLSASAVDDTWSIYLPKVPLQPLYSTTRNENSSSPQKAKLRKLFSSKSFRFPAKNKNNGIDFRDIKYLEEVDAEVADIDIDMHLTAVEADDTASESESVCCEQDVNLNDNRLASASVSCGLSASNINEMEMERPSRLMLQHQDSLKNHRNSNILETKNEIVKPETKVYALSEGRSLVKKRKVKLKRLNKHADSNGIVRKRSHSFDNAIVLQNRDSMRMRTNSDSAPKPNKFIYVPSLVVGKTLNNWNLDVFAFGKETCQRPLTWLMTYIFKAEDFFSKFDIPKNAFNNFCRRMEAGYNSDIPYHNNFHAADVVNSAYYLVKTANFGMKLDPLSFFALIFAAAVHDLRHPGRTARFLIHNRDPLSIRYNDKSILEQMHLAEAFDILASETENCDILANLSEQDYLRFRRLVIHSVLCTDLKEHLETIKKLKLNENTLFVQNYDDIGSSSKSNSLVVDDDILLLTLETAIKVADIGHAGKSLKLHMIWSHLIQEEFYLQGDAERELGLTISPHMDRQTPDIAQNQLSFMKFIVLPLFDSVAALQNISNKFLDIYKQVLTNEEQWKDIDKTTKLRSKMI